MTTNQTTPTDRSHELLLLGQIHGIVQALRDGQKVTNERLDQVDRRIDGMDGRLRVVETKAAVNGTISGAVSGSAVSIGIVLIVEALKDWLKRGTPSP